VDSTTTAQTMSPNRTMSRWLWWIVAVYAFLVGIYMLPTPPMEASDELWHMGMVAQIREARALPVQDPSIEETRYEQEGSQPPLYYAVVAALTLPISFDDFDAISQMNPHAKVGVPGATDNKNIVLHTPISASAQSSLAVYIGRIFSALCVAWAIVMVYRVGHLLGGELVGLLARASPLSTRCSFLLRVR
jgi:hypothetical protein